MKSRMFLSGMAAVTAAPALPNISLVKAATTFTAAQDHYWVASLIAQTRGAVSATGLAQQLRIPLSLAQEVQTLLIQRGIVTAPVAGLTKAVNPMQMPAPAHVPSASTSLHPKLKNPKLDLEKWVEDTQAPTTEETENEKDLVEEPSDNLHSSQEEAAVKSP